MTFLVRAPERRLAERRYVLDVVLKEWLGLDYELTPSDGPDVSLQPAGDHEGRDLTLPDTLFSTPPDDWLTTRSMPRDPAVARGGDRPSAVRPHGRRRIAGEPAIGRGHPRRLRSRRRCARPGRDADGPRIQPRCVRECVLPALPVRGGGAARP